MNVFGFEDYKEYVNQALQKIPGRGARGRLAVHLGIHSSLLSQILKGSRHFTLEQGFSLAQFLEMDGRETEYFMCLLNAGRAGSIKLQDFYHQQMLKIRLAGDDGPALSGGTVDEKHRTEFYSNWYYSGIRLLTSIEKFQTPEAIAKKLDLPLEIVNYVLSFLVKSGLCIKQGKLYKIGQRFTSLEFDSPMSSRHQTNWRIKALDRLPRRTAHEYFLSFPMAIAESDMGKVRGILLRAVEDIEKLIDDSPCEKLACLNIDWFDV